LQVRIRRVGHAFRPDVEAAPGRTAELRVAEFPRAPDAFAFVVPLVEYVVAALVALGPMALAVAEIVATTDGKGADPVAAFAADFAGLEGEPGFHQVASRELLLQKEPRPGTAGEAGIGFDCLGFGLGHNDCSCETTGSAGRLC